MVDEDSKLNHLNDDRRNDRKHFIQNIENGRKHPKVEMTENISLKTWKIEENT